MKRGGPLRRKKPLRAKQGLARSMSGQGGALPRGGGLARRPGTGRYKPTAAELAEEARAQLLWRWATCQPGVCACCGKPPTDADPLEAHHVLPQQYIKRYVNALRLTKSARWQLLRELLWDRRNGMPLLQSCHRRHTRASKRVPWRCLQVRHLEFARALGMEHVLDKQYPQEV